MFENLHSNKKIEFLIDDSYPVFLLNNFLDDSQFKLIKKNLCHISRDFALQNYDLNYHNSKLSINKDDTPELHRKIVLDNYVIRELIKYLNSEKFVKYILDNFFKHILRTRKNDLSYFLKLLFRKNRVNLKRKKFFFEKFLFNEIIASTEISYMYNKSKIVPHTDSRSKLVSLMLYFPEDDLTNDQILSLGTSFYKSELKNLNNSHLRDPEQEIKFKKNSKKILTLPFQGCNLYGFIRSETSWHTVEPLDIHEDFIRKSININLLLG